MRVTRVNERIYGKGGTRIEVMYWALTKTECGLGHTAERARINARRKSGLRTHR